MQTLARKEVFPSGVIRQIAEDGKSTYTFADGSVKRKSPVDGWPESVSRAGGMVCREFPEGGGSYVLFMRSENPEKIAKEFAVMQQQGFPEMLKRAGTHTAATVHPPKIRKAEAPVAPASKVAAATTGAKAVKPANQIVEIPQSDGVTKVKAKWCVFGRFTKAGKAAGVFTINGTSRVKNLPEDFYPEDYDYYAEGFKSEVTDRELQEAEICKWVKAQIAEGKLKVSWRPRDLSFTWPREDAE